MTHDPKPCYCTDCTSLVELDSHGRCPTCGSDAVCVAVPETQPGWWDVPIRVPIMRKESK
jgi:hypothetical protein